MFPRKILAVASGRRCAASVANYFQRRTIDGNASRTHLSQLFFSSWSDGKERPEEHEIANHHGQQQQQQQQQRNQNTDDQSSHQSGTQQDRLSQNWNHHRPRYKSNDKTTKSRKQRSSSTKNTWLAPFWRPPPSSSSSTSPRKKNRNARKHQRPLFGRRTINSFRDTSLPCRKHLDPTNSMGYPTSDWVEIFGALPMTSLEEVLDSIENALRNEVLKSEGIVDLDAEWNPHTDGEDLPLVPPVLEIPIDDDPVLADRREYALDTETFGHYSSINSIDTNGNSEFENTNTETTMTIESFRVVKAHVILSPFGRPTGWHLKLTSPSMVHALLAVAEEARVKGVHMVGWKFTKVKEHHPPSSESLLSYDTNDTRTMLVVSDSMVRFENCPEHLTEDNLRFMLSRYELTRKGTTIIRWRGRVGDGRVQPVTYVVRFDSPAYARAAVREMQGKMLDGRPMKLVQYPRQLL